MQKYVLGFAFNSLGEQVALILKNRPVWQAGKLNGIGGKIEHEEPMHAAMVREFREETGVTTEDADWTLYAILSGAEFVVYTFRCRLDDKRFGQVHSCTDEDVLVLPLDAPEIRKYGISNIPWLIAAACDPDSGRMVLTARYGALASAEATS
jgi:8-oxo-dGTP diphosphatase